MDGIMGNYSFKSHDGYLLMEIAGKYDYWEFIKYPELIRKQCERTGIYRILVDVIEVTYDELPTLELFFLGEKLAEVLRDKVKIALVWHGDNKERFLETVAANRAATIRIFPSKNTAKFWLLYDFEDEPFDFQKN